MENNVAEQSITKVEKEEFTESTMTQEFIRLPKRYVQFKVDIFGVECDVFGKINGIDSTTIVCTTPTKYMIYQMSGVPLVDMKPIQDTFFNEKFQFIVNILR